MTQYRFKWYLHEASLRENEDEFARLNPDLPEHVVDHLVGFNPFYEVTVTGTYDTETKKIELDGASW